MHTHTHVTQTHTHNCVSFIRKVYSEHNYVQASPRGELQQNFLQISVSDMLPKGTIVADHYVLTGTIPDLALF